MSHIPGDQPRSLRSDKVLSPSQLEALFAGLIAVEEKVDGSNVGFSAADGDIRVQHRGDYVGAGEQYLYPRLASWLAERDRSLRHELGTSLVLFGEWCAARHTVRYDCLPDWFLAFDVFDRTEGRFWSRARRDQLCQRLGLSVVPLLAEGEMPLAAVKRLLGRSRLGAEPMEGIVVRRDEGSWLAASAKLVRPNFLQSDARHWRSRSIESNQLAAAGTTLA